MSLFKRSRPFLLILLAGLFVFGTYSQGERAVGLRIELLDGATEARDESLLGIGEAGVPPDYQLQVVVGGETFDLGVREDTWIGEGQVFELPGPCSIAALESASLTERDQLADDDLEVFALADLRQTENRQVEGQAYRLIVLSERNLWHGIEDFLGTPMGILLLVLIGTGATIGVFERMLDNQDRAQNTTDDQP